MVIRTRKGFTLIELLIVVAIIGILAAIAVPNFLNAQMRAKLAQVESNMKALSTAIMSYTTDNNSYPLHDPNHVYNVMNNALTTPVSYIVRIPDDVFQTYMNSKTSSLAERAVAELHPEPLYAPAYGAVGMDQPIPKKGSSGDLTLRFQQDPGLYAKAQNLYPNGRYLVSIGPDLIHNFPGVYNGSNGLNSSGDIIRVVP